MRARACVVLWRSGLGEKKCDWLESEMCTGVRGHKGAQENCDTMMNHLFKDLIDQEVVVVYMDDILIFTRTIEEH
jgi:hypothetical protein